MVLFEDHLQEIRRCEEMLKTPRNKTQKQQLQRRLHRLRREYRQAKMYAAQAGKK